MGLFMIRCKANNKCHMEAVHNLNGRMNRSIFQLRASLHPGRELQRDWTEYGEESFAVDVLEKLEYEKDDPKTDYSEELAILRMIWEERATRQGMELYG